MRKFKTGATRDTEDFKYDYEGALSPIVLEAFGRYMHKHRLQPDGSLRDDDNWQKLFGEDHYSVCIKSGWRHFLDWWKEHRGYQSRDGMEDALMGLLFNIMAYAFKYLNENNEIEKSKKQKTEESVRGISEEGWLYVKPNKSSQKTSRKVSSLKRKRLRKEVEYETQRN